jgi:hypothetical protein
MICRIQVKWSENRNWLVLLKARMHVGKGNRFNSDFLLQYPVVHYRSKVTFSFWHQEERTGILRCRGSNNAMIQHFLNVLTYYSHLGRAMAKVVSRRTLTAETRVNPCGICGGQSGTGTGFSPNSSVFPCQYNSKVALQTHIVWGMRNMLT